MNGLEFSQRINSHVQEGAAVSVSQNVAQCEAGAPRVELGGAELNFQAKLRVVNEAFENDERYKHITLCGNPYVLVLVDGVVCERGKLRDVSEGDLELIRNGLFVFHDQYTWRWENHGMVYTGALLIGFAAGGLLFNIEYKKSVGQVPVLKVEA